MEPPQLFFPEKITRLVTRDPSIRSGKLICKDTMWWNGIELVSQRPKLGLLGRWSQIFSFSAFTIQRTKHITTGEIFLFTCRKDLGRLRIPSFVPVTRFAKIITKITSTAVFNYGRFVSYFVDHRQ